MSFVIVQSNHGHSSDSNALGSAVTAGNLLVLAVNCDHGKPIVAVTDTQSNTWVQIGTTQVDSTAGQEYSFWYCQNAAAGTTTATIHSTAGGTSNGFQSLVFTEISGVATSGALVQNSQTASLGTTTTSANAEVAPAITDTANNLVIGMLAVVSFAGTVTVTAGTGLTMIATDPGVSSAAGAVALEWKTAAGGSEQVKFTVNKAAHKYAAFCAEFAALSSTNWTQPLSDSITMTDSPGHTWVAQLGLADSTTLTDALVKNFASKQADSLSLTDSLAHAWVAFKTLTDSTTLTDAIVKNFGKKTADTTTLTDAIVKSFGSKRSDSITLTDSLAKNFGLSRGDSITVTDTFGRTWVIARTMSDTITATDALGKNVSLGKADTLSLSDVLTTTQGKQILLSDSISLADAIFKNVGVKRADTVSLADVFSRTAVYQRSLSDTVTLSDALAKGMGIKESDSVSLTDAAGKGMGKVVTDTTTLTDAVAKAVGLTKTDSVTITEAVAKNMAHKLADTVTLTDVATPVLTGAGTAWTLNLADAITLADAFVRTLTNSGAGPGTVGRARSIFLSRFGIY